jgi:dihydrofolate reductase
MHISLDGFVAGPNGEMDWIYVSDEMFDYAGQRTREADAALYGRVTYQMMQSYWPTAAEKPAASRHDVEHSKWYNSVNKIVVSRTLKGTSLPKTTIIEGDVAANVSKIKQTSGKDILLLGSPSIARILISAQLVDDYWLFVNPILLGNGLPLFSQIKERTSLNPVENKGLSGGVVLLHYSQPGSKWE